MTRAAIYARYSTDLQSEKSIGDQFADCRVFAARQGYHVVSEFCDRALTSATLIGRDGMLSLMGAARNGKFDVVIVESLDRISRNQADLAGVYERLTFVGVYIESLNGGRADQTQVGLRALVGAIYLTDLSEKVRRGLRGVVNDGRVAGGRAYGYRAVPGQPGKMVIDEAEATVIREIFERYIAGYTPREIAAALNKKGMTPPRGRDWNASTINGSLARSNGILTNRLYVGEIVWNRVSMIRNPDTGKRVSRPNPNPIGKPELRRT